MTTSINYLLAIGNAGPSGFVPIGQLYYSVLSGYVDQGLMTETDAGGFRLTEAGMHQLNDAGYHFEEGTWRQ